MADPVAGIAGSAAKSVRPFRSSEAYVEAMKEDLAEWLNALYGLGLPSGGDGFLMGLATGTTLCQHANAVTEAAHAMAAARPARGVAFQAHSVVPGSFMARDNVATFIGWCRAELGVPEVLMFETEDLVLRKNEKSVVLCLLEVARRGARLGLLAPRLVQFEQEIERELRATPPASNTPSAGEDTTETAATPGAPARGPRMTPSDLRNLDELVSPQVRLPGGRAYSSSTQAPAGRVVRATFRGLSSWLQDSLPRGKRTYVEHQVDTRPQRVRQAQRGLSAG